MSKITVKSTKEQMKDFLNGIFKEVKKVDKNLAERITYTGNAYTKDPASVMKKDLYDLCKEAMALDITPVKPVAEASVKPIVKKGANTTKSTEEETPKKAPKKVAKKAVTSKSAKKEEPIVTPVEVKTKSEKEIPLAEMFKEKYESEQLGTLEIAHDIKTFEDLKKALVDNEEVIIIAVYWTKRMIKQFQYGENLNLKVVPSKFKEDVDLATFLYIGETNDIAYAVSSETDGIYNIHEEDLKEEEGLRFTGGCEYQIYRQTAEPQE